MPCQDWTAVLEHQCGLEAEKSEHPGWWQTCDPAIEHIWLYDQNLKKELLSKNGIWAVALLWIAWDKYKTAIINKDGCFCDCIPYFQRLDRANVPQQDWVVFLQVSQATCHHPCLHCSSMLLTARSNPPWMQCDHHSGLRSGNHRKSLPAPILFPILLASPESSTNSWLLRYLYIAILLMMFQKYTKRENCPQLTEHEYKTRFAAIGKAEQKSKAKLWQKEV